MEKYKQDNKNELLRTQKNRPDQGASYHRGLFTSDYGSKVVDVGHCLRKLRAERDLSIRSLAERSGLNVNTLSLIENGKSSPSVSTLQQLATALEVPITAFFESDIPKNNISYLQVR